MKKIFILFMLCFLIVAPCAISQSIGVGTSNPNGSSLIDITSTNKGLLIPRMTTAGISSIVTPAKGLMVYDSIKNQLMVNMGNNTVPNWQTIVFNSGWSLNGNSGLSAATNFIGTTDTNPMLFKINNEPTGILGQPNHNLGFGRSVLRNLTSGIRNIAIGDSALYSNTTGSFNVANGDQALYTNTTGHENTANGYRALYSNTDGYGNVANGIQALYSNTGGAANTANGYQALYSNTTSVSNTATGYRALYSNTTGEGNTANGTSALYSNIAGYSNTANGTNALSSNTFGYNNVANGYDALSSNTTGLYNTANGYEALYDNITGSYNAANGAYALSSNTTGVNNSANGYSALYLNTTGGRNTANGLEALRSNTTGSYNVADGYQALYGTTLSNYNTAIGTIAGATFNNGQFNVFAGYGADVNGAGYNNAIAIGYNTTCAASNQVTIGNGSTISYRIYGSWSNISDGNYKKDVREDVPGLAFIKKLRPVTYNLDATGLDNFLHKNLAKRNQTDDKAKEIMNKALKEKGQIRYTGFVAQEVEQSAKELGFDFSGIDAPKNKDDVYALRYAEFVVPLVKAVQEQQLIIEKLQKQVEAGKAEIPMEIGKQQVMIEDLKKQNAGLLTRIDELEKAVKELISRVTPIIK